MFSGCCGLSSLELSKFNTAKVKNMLGMFSGCTGLTSLDLSSFNTTNVEDIDEMFMTCTNLKTIYVDTWDISNAYYGFETFTGCVSLVGGMGTKYDEDHQDQTYARIDGGPSSPGYFTYKANKGN